jgi:ferritin-like metal-binding protein YciE
MRIDDLGMLFLEELKDMYSAEQQILKALPALRKAATSEELKGVLESHREVTKQHIARLEDIFETHEKSAVGKQCKGMAGLLEEATEVIKADMDPDVKDAALIAAVQRVEHYEMAVYGSLRNFARVLGDTASARILQATLEDEGQADRDLTRLAEEAINVRAHTGADASRDEE